MLPMLMGPAACAVCVSIAFKLIANQSISTRRTSLIYISAPRCDDEAISRCLPIPTLPSPALQQVLQFCSGSHWTLPVPGCLYSYCCCTALSCTLVGLLRPATHCCHRPTPLCSHYSPRLRYGTLAVVVVVAAAVVWPQIDAQIFTALCG